MAFAVSSVASRKVVFLYNAGVARLFLALSTVWMKLKMTGLMQGLKMTADGARVTSM